MVTVARRSRDVVQRGILRIGDARAGRLWRTVARLQRRIRDLPGVSAAGVHSGCAAPEGSRRRSGIPSRRGDAHLRQ